MWKKLILIAICLGGVALIPISYYYKKHILDDDVYFGNIAESPSVFWLVRDENEKMPGEELLITEALSALGFPKENERTREEFISYYENIVVVDEGDAWAVTFLIRGDGDLRRKPLAHNVTILDGKGATVYLQKGSLAPVAKEAKYLRAIY